MDLVDIKWDSHAFTFSVSLSAWIGLAMLAIIAAGLIWRRRATMRTLSSYEVDQAEIGVGVGTISLRPNLIDRQVAYAIWVELATRKIGLPLDAENDVIDDIYESWYTFFGVTRELIKTISVSKVTNPDTAKIVWIAVAVLNTAIRPHLTRWQARFRRWYARELANLPPGSSSDPQEIQRRFEDFDRLWRDLEAVNHKLIAYRKTMGTIVYGPQGELPVG